MPSLSQRESRGFKKGLAEWLCSFPNEREIPCFSLHGGFFGLISTDVSSREKVAWESGYS